MDAQSLITLGQTLGHIQSGITSTEKRVDRIEKEVGMLKDRVQRGALLAILWALGSVLHLKAETLGEILAATIKGLIK